MAGKFLSLEEAARRLGVSLDEINRLVDRKELFPMRDGGTIKFKVDEVERVAADLAAGGSQGSMAGNDLDLDLDLAGSVAGGQPAGSGVDDLGLDSIAGGDESIFADSLESGPPSSSHTVVRGTAGTGTSNSFETDDLALDSIAGISSPSLAGLGPATGGSGPVVDSGTLEIDLPGDSGRLAGAGSGLSQALDSGLSLEGSGIAPSGIDLDASLGGGAGATGVGSLAASGSLAGDAFELGAEVGDEESASVVIPTEETGDSSFFEAAADDSASVTFDGAGGSAEFAGSTGGLGDIELAPAAAPLSVWQVVGLVSSTLLLFLASLVVFDVLQSVRAPSGQPISGPIFSALAKTFGW
jgi:excisionase family DNA binding protein